MAINHLLISEYSEQQMHQTIACLSEVYYRLHSHTFLLTSLFSLRYQTQGENYNHFPCNWIICFLEAYKQPVYYRTVFPLFLKYLVRIECTISTWVLTS